MESLNYVKLIGTVDTAPVVKTYNKKDGSEGTRSKMIVITVDERDWRERHMVVGWEGVAQYVRDTVNMGDEVTVEGQIKTRMYKDESGAKKYVTEISARTITK